MVFAPILWSLGRNFSLYIELGSGKRQGGMRIMGKCGCGRSPTGMCKGWHGLSKEEYEKKLLEHKEETKEE